MLRDWSATFAFELHRILLFVSLTFSQHLLSAESGNSIALLRRTFACSCCNCRKTAACFLFRFAGKFAALASLSGSDSGRPCKAAGGSSTELSSRVCPLVFSPADATTPCAPSRSLSLSMWKLPACSHFQTTRSVQFTSLWYKFARWAAPLVGLSPESCSAVHR